ncbi:MULTISPECIES: hypothetical protein [Roseobacteraceae]|uniref:hypothetical protein n=1 Tax=Roseobacteraceae TaxID=2854170 RepID=UPI0031D22409
MPLQLFLNELSVPNEQPARAVSIKRLKQLVATVRQARGLDSTAILNSHVPLSNFPLGDQTTIASVRNDGECIEESLYLKAVNNRSPMALTKENVGEEDPDLCEYRIQPAAPVQSGQIALGLGYAHFFRGLGLSLASHEFWLEQSIELELTKLTSAGEISIVQVSAMNADSPSAIDFNADQIRALLAPSFSSGAEFWERRAELCPNLVFIPRTRSQLEGIQAGDPLLEQTWAKLSGIDKAIGAWKISKAKYPMFPFNVRPESKSRRALTEFKDNEGYMRAFSDHCDLAPSECRIHFIVEAEPHRHALIGHIGRELGIG